jgi:hypothetical protein
MHSRSPVVEVASTSSTYDLETPEVMQGGDQAVLMSVTAAT